jgi:hypothetical protein
MTDDDILHYLADRFSGSFRLVSAEFTGPRGESFYPFGERPVGCAVNQGVRVNRAVRRVEGRFYAQLMNPERGRLAGDFPTPQEAVHAYATYVAYYGAMAIDLANVEVETGRSGEVVRATGVLVNGVVAALNPNWVGGEQVRYFEMAGERLVLRMPPLQSATGLTTGALSWERE